MTGIIKVDDLKDAGGNSIISSNGSGTFTYTFNAGSIAGAAIANDAIDSAHYADGSIDLAHMSANSVDSDQYVDGSIDLAHMSANSIDSDQYVDGSIDTAHIADNQITLAKMAGLARGKIIYGDASGDPAALTVGSNGQALVSDGTDISWGAAGASLSGSTNNTVATVTGANALAGEANLTFDGTDLTVGTGNVVFGTTAKGLMFDGTDGQITHNASTNTLTICTGGFTDQFNIFPRNTSAGSYGIMSFGDASINNNHWKFNFYDETHGKGMIRLENGVTGGSNHPNGGLLVVYSGASPDGSPAAEYILCSDSTATRFQVNSDGDCKNHDNAYGAISDERIKQDIRDANSQWDDIKGLRVRNFKRKDDVRQYGDKAWEQIGLIAQEAELVSPKLIRETTPSESDLISDPSFGEIVDDTDAPNGDGTFAKKIRVDQNVKAMQYSVLYMKAIKCLQEAQTRIETLEAKVAVLEG